MNLRQKDKGFEKSNCNDLTIIIPSSCTVLFINWSQSTLERRSVSWSPFYSLASFSYSALSWFAKCIQNSLYSSFRSNVKRELHSLWHERVLFAFHILQPLRTQTPLFFPEWFSRAEIKREFISICLPSDHWSQTSDNSVAALKLKEASRTGKEKKEKVPWLHCHCQIMVEIAVWEHHRCFEGREAGDGGLWGH